uniref:NADH-ubiquinone oxidoreductase chain 4L n=1 Tax=Pachyhynobius shangchengensis TaxID=288317 RepID=Q1HUD4_9AMPH|nr:NADH dehydrogenase subunit 4L [Pachyhynobius shangchengensis]ABC56003.1 NADH dehydrogenase subunit 4L [Pachyhynobius shangchengensis]QCS26699.1 NADH dehydrogenase subunit 4L [Pachyhynobius shangchengensis]QCS26712.1 NADH dehydrogenase subunit 4L [Pachyhynobius shangchengensis]QCS26725.1 NADH dehydrogenase subunit 4L [Pachyhynobius shangchengensis]QCS26738.1 NADH dehydrogenase subunit 4L [Pachyhynobius shangchengensis]
MSPTYSVFFTTFMLSILGLTFHRTHLLSALLCLEGMMLALFIALSFWSIQFEMLSYFSLPMFMLTFSACEASTGLALMVATSRTHGNDHLKNLNLLQC